MLCSFHKFLIRLHAFYLLCQFILASIITSGSGSVKLSRFFALDFRRLQEEENANHKQHRDSAHAGIDIAGNL